MDTFPLNHINFTIYFKQLYMFFIILLRILFHDTISSLQTIKITLTHNLHRFTTLQQWINSSSVFTELGY